MLLTMIVVLFTSRILLKELGEVDYGLYSAVVGFVTMFSIISEVGQGPCPRDHSLNNNDIAYER